MKILDGTRTVFTTGLASLLSGYMRFKIAHGELAWLKSINVGIEEAVGAIGAGLQLDYASGYIDRVKLLRQLGLIKLYLLAMDLEASNIDHILDTHELLRKDNVQEIMDVKRRYMDIINHSSNDYRTRNIDIRNGQIRLFPTLARDFKVKGVTVSYGPEGYAAKAGNDPTPENITAGTNKGYWQSTIYTASDTAATAVITLSYGAMIAFNRIRINTAGKFPARLTSVEVRAGSTWTSVLTTPQTSKFIDVTFSQIYTTDQVRLTMTQPLADYTWWTTLDNKQAILDPEQAEDAQEEASKRAVRNVEFEPVTYTKLSNVWAHDIGAYNIITYLDIYSGSTDGIFYSRKFTSTKPIEYIELASDMTETKPGSSTITYHIIQQDGSATAINPGQRLVLDKLFYTTETLTSGTGNYVELRSVPLKSGIQTTVDGITATLVETFSDTGNLEYMISGNRLFFSQPVEGHTVTTTYNHRTDYVIAKITLNNGTTENQYTTPIVENFGVLINGQTT